MSLDDLDVLDLARRDPDALVRGTLPVTLDEVQREPDLLSAVKREIDRERRPGRFLLTGSANLLLMRRVSESLAGRASYLTLWPMTRREQLGLGRCGIWEKLLEVPDRDWLDVVAAHAGEREDWQAWALRGGFPFPAVHLGTSTERAIWFDGYVLTYLERDLQALSSIAALPDFRRLMRAACLPPRITRQPERPGPGHRTAAADRASLPEPARDGTCQRFLGHEAHGFREVFPEGRIHRPNPYPLR